MEIFDPFFKFIAGVLSFFYSVVPSYGLSIILLTVTVMVVITPLTYKSTKSMLQMQRLQPELKRIQAQYKDDRERLNQELMAFYKEHNLNPLGGCLPLFIQAPVFIVLYRVLHGLTTRFGGAGSGAGHIAGQLYPRQHADALADHRSTVQPDVREHVIGPVQVAVESFEDELPGHRPLVDADPGLQDRRMDRNTVRHPDCPDDRRSGDPEPADPGA